MFVDASAMIAILTCEPDADALSDALDDASGSITSPMAIFETVLGLCRKRHASVAEAYADLRIFLQTANISIVPITDTDTATALDAASRYGKGRGHPAQLNFGDCFAYASARTHGVSLLFKGDDFGHTDIMRAAA